MMTVSAGGGHGSIFVVKSVAGGGVNCVDPEPTNSYFSLQGDFLHLAEIFYIGKNLWFW